MNSLKNRLFKSKMSIPKVKVNKSQISKFRKVKKQSICTDLMFFNFLDFV